MDISKKYVKLEQREHVLQKPGMYIGNVEPDKYEIWLLNEDGSRMEKRTIDYIAGLFKIFDEIVANATDHYIRLKNADAAGEDVNLVKDIKVNINKETGIISVFNSGDGIDILMHPQHKIYIPELIFGNMLTSTNYTDDERLGVGTNGVGGKVTNIFSEWFELETVDSERKQVYKQRFEQNMSITGKPDIKKCAKKPYTLITFKPDYKRFGLQTLSDDMYEVLRKRTYDLCAVTDKDINIYFNEQKLEFKTFEKYVDLYIGAKSEHTRVYECVNERWEIIASYNQFNGFEQISFVNGLLTIRGGKHVEYIVNQIVKKVSELITKKSKNTVIKPQAIKDNLILFVKCSIINPVFDSQSKETLTTPSSKFGSKAEISDKFIDKLYKSGLADKVLEISAIHEEKTLKKTDGKKRDIIRGLPKLEDANWAGTVKSKECLLILTEGDSAASSALAGVAEVGRDRYGIFPLKGKVMNVKDAAVSKIADNDEITNIKKILGLETGKKYTKIDDLRYGGIMLLTDSDYDGSHIKGLVMNLFHSMWSSLVKDFKFIHCMQTPIIKVRRRDEVIAFYTLTEFSNWKEANNGGMGWNIKYYKGLGTSTEEEAKDWFKNMKMVTYTFTDQSDGSIDLAFNKKRADDRKEWLENYDRQVILEYNVPEVSYEDFINKELIHFSNYDVERSIPSMVDGLKISQRKIIYSCFKRNLTDKEIKVAQLAAYVAEQSAYHHGEVSLQGAIVNLAQDFVGSNNINLLKPNGQFGCLDPETEILMWDTTKKKAKDIRIGDKLVGDDGKMRNVLQTTEGIDDMYEIVMLNGSFKVNSQHILTLKFPEHKHIIWKNSSKSWNLQYFDTDNMAICSKSYRTTESTTNNHFNASTLSKVEAYMKIKEFSDSLKFKDTFDIKVDDYLKLPKYAMESLYCVYNSNCIEWDKCDVPIDPYIFGLWLGDGNKNGTGITSADKEILIEFAQYLDTISCELVHDTNKGRENKEAHDGYHFTVRKKGYGFRTSIGDSNHCSEFCLGCQTTKTTHEICSWKFDKTPANPSLYKGVAENGMRRNDMNPWKELLKKSGVFNNKHIPKVYIMNDKTTRLNVLAGLIDSDGTIKTQLGIPYIEVAQSKRIHENIIYSADYIARSLGFVTSIYIYKRNDVTKKGEDKTRITLRITGDNLDEIPTKLPHKKIVYDKNRQRDCYTNPFEVKYLGKGPFCGWQVDGNERFLLGDFTVTHNSRLHGGKDAAQPRYIFTLLTNVAVNIFKKQDNCVLNYLDDDGLTVEPDYYLPVLPMILVNGAMGIGTGFSTSIPCYNPMEIVDLLKKMLRGEFVSEEENDLTPWYRGFAGEIKKINNKYHSLGKFSKISATKIEVTELPLGYWTFDFKSDLENLLDKIPEFRKYENQSSGNKVCFVLHFANQAYVDGLLEVESNGQTKFENLFKLVSPKGLSTTNMYAFNSKGQIKKFDTSFDIVNEFYDVRLQGYKKRKAHILSKLEYDAELMQNKIRFIQEVVSEKVVIYKMKKSELEEYLAAGEYMKHEGGYDYITRIPIYNLTLDKVKEFEDEILKAKEEIAGLKEKKEQDMWLEELEAFEVAYKTFLESATAGGVGKGAGKKKSGK